MSTAYRIPDHLPERLTISFWLWNYFYGTGEGDAFRDLERCFVELEERKFNTVRIESGAGLCHTPQGTPRGAIALRKPFDEYSTLRQMDFRGCASRCDVAEHLVGLFERARDHGIYVILSSWFYLHTFWFVDDAIREELYALPWQERYMVFARAYDRLIDRLKEKELHRQIAFVEIFNEFNCLDAWWRLLDADASEADKTRIRSDLQGTHEEALAFLRERHPDLLWAMDTGGATPPLEILPRNAQVWNHHIYYGWEVYFKLLENYVQSEDFDFRNATKHPVLGRFLRTPCTEIASIRNTRNRDPRVEEGWYRRVWLYTNLKPEAIPELDRLLDEAFSRDIEEYRKAAEESVAAAVSIRDAHYPNIPMVMGEGATYCAHTGMRWEERSDTYWDLIDHVAGLLKRHGYWGSVPRTHSGPEDPSWTEYPERLRHANECFLS